MFVAKPENKRQAIPKLGNLVAGEICKCNTVHEKWKPASGPWSKRCILPTQTGHVRA